MKPGVFRSWKAAALALGVLLVIYIGIGLLVAVTIAKLR